MTVARITDTRCFMGSDSSIEAIQSNLEALARYHRVSVPELLKSAEAAGTIALPYQRRALVLAKRLEKLQDD